MTGTSTRGNVSSESARVEGRRRAPGEWIREPPTERSSRLGRTLPPLLGRRYKANQVCPYREKRPDGLNLGGTTENNLRPRMGTKVF